MYPYRFFDLELVLDLGFKVTLLILYGKSVLQWQQIRNIQYTRHIKKQTRNPLAHTYTYTYHTYLTTYHTNIQT